MGLVTLSGVKKKNPLNLQFGVYKFNTLQIVTSCTIKSDANDWHIIARSKENNAAKREQSRNLKTHWSAQLNTPFLRHATSTGLRTEGHAVGLRRDRMFIISSGVCFHCICPRVPGVIKCLCARLRPLLLCVASRPKATYSTIGLPERLQISFGSAEKNWGTLLVCVVGKKGLCQVTWYIRCWRGQ